MSDEVEVTQEQIEESQAEMPPIDEKIDEKEKKEENGLSAEEKEILLGIEGSASYTQITAAKRQAEGLGRV